MEIVQITVEQIIVMFLLIVVGVICYQTKILDSQKSRVLSDVLIKVITPALIIDSFQREFEMELLRGFLISIALTALSLSLAYLIGRVLIRENSAKDVRIERFAVIFSNCGFMGIPLAYGILGGEGVFYIIAYNMLFDIIVFSCGEGYMKGASIYTVKDIVKLMINPATVASLIGIIIFVCNIHIPELISKPIGLVADMNTPVAMLVAGVSVAQANIPKLIKNWRLYYIAAIKLLIVPIAVVLICKLLPISQTVLLAVGLAAACPAGTLTVMFSVMYGRDDVYASEIFSSTTLLSIITIPVIVAIAML